MNLPWHIVKKDLRRFWPAGALLIGITALILMLVHGVLAPEIDSSWIRRMHRDQFFLILAQWILSFMVAVAIVHEDPVSDRGAFWEILPIARWQLLMAKLVVVGLLTLFPVLVTLTVGWVALGLPLGLLGWPLVVIAQAQLGICVFGFTFASLTKNMAHVIFWVIGAYLVLFIPAVFPIQLGNELGLAPVTSFDIFDGALMMAGIAVILNQYLGRSRRWSVAFLIAGVSCSVAMGMFSLSWSLTQIMFPLQRRVDHLVSNLAVKVTEATIEGPKVGYDATALVRVSIDDRNAPFMITPYAYFGEWIPAEGAPVYSQAKELYQIVDHAFKRTVDRTFGYTDPSLPSLLDIGAETLVSSADAGRIRNQSLLYDGQIGLKVRSVAIDGEVDLIAGATLESTSGSVVVKRVEKGSSVIRLEIEAHNSGLMADPDGFFDFTGEVKSMNSYTYALVSQDSRTVVTSSRTSSRRSAYAYGILLDHEKLEFVLPADGLGNRGMAGWKLVQIRYGQEMRATRSFQQRVRLNDVPAIIRDPSWLK